MKAQELRIQHLQSDIVCDNVNCDFEDIDVKSENYQDWIDKPCPKCGENLLTEKDFATFHNVNKIIDLLNNMSDEEYKKFEKTLTEKDYEIYTQFGIDFGKCSDAHVEMVIKAHDGIQIESINPIDNEQSK